MISQGNRSLYQAPAASKTHTSAVISIDPATSILLVKLAWENAGNISSVRLNNSAGTKLTEVPGSRFRTTSGNRVATMYYLADPPAGNVTIWVGLSASFVLAFEVVSFLGTDEAASIADVEGSRTNSAASLATSALVPVGTGNWLETVICGGNHNLSFTPQNGAIETADVNVRSAFRLAASRLDIVDANVIARWVASGSQAMALSALLLKPMSGGGNGGGGGSPEPGGSTETIGAMSGAGNFFRSDAASHKIADLTALHCGQARVSCHPKNDYFAGEAPSPSAMDAVVVALLQAGVQPYFSFVFTDDLNSAEVGIPQRNYADWFNIGQAFAARFKKGSSFLVSQGITDLGAYGYAAINEPDHDGSETPGLTHTQYHDMLHGLADGVHSGDSDGKVWPAGYLSGNRDQEYTGHGYCLAVAGLINDGTLAGFDLHTYHAKNGAKIHDTYNRSHQHDADQFVVQCGITRQDIDIICTETNIRGDPDATAQGYDEATARRWFLTSMFDVWGTLKPNGTVSQGPRFPWQLWTQGDPVWYMASQLQPRVEHWCGHTYKLLLNLLWDMHFTANDPSGTGVHKLKGGGKSAWAFQNIHSSWSSLFASTFTISDIPAGTTRIDVYDGMGLVQTVDAPGVPVHQFSTATGKSYLFVANAE